MVRMFSMAEAIVMAPTTVIADARHQAIKLFVVGFLVLFLELACIRWFTSYVLFLQFFTNLALLAAFLCMSCGCLAANQPHDWLGRLPPIALGAVIAPPM